MITKELLQNIQSQWAGKKDRAEGDVIYYSGAVDAAQVLLDYLSSNETEEADNEQCDRVSETDEDEASAEATPV